MAQTEVLKTGQNLALSRRRLSAARTPASSWATTRPPSIQLWQEKRGEIEPEDLSGNLVVQLGLATEELNRRWYEANTGQVVTDVQSRGVRGQVHAALVVLGRGSSGKTYAAAAA
jgi:hypothetical protein